MRHSRFVLSSCACLRNILGLFFTIAAFATPVTLWADDGSYVLDEVLVRYVPGADGRRSLCLNRRTG